MSSNNDSDSDIMVPFTKEELQNVQITILSQMMQLNNQVRNGTIPPQLANQEIQALTQVNDKMSNMMTHSKNLNKQTR